MKIDDIISVEIIDEGINGEGIARQNDNVIFVPFALKGEIVEVKVKKIQKNLIFTDLQKIIKRSEKRVDAKCPYFQICGGCDLMHTKYENQLQIKTNNVKQTLQKFLKKDVNVASCQASECEYAYRNKIELPVHNEKIGFYKKNSHSIVEIDDCKLCAGWLKTFLQIARQALKNNIAIKHIVLRYVNNNLVVVLVTSSKHKVKKDIWIELLQKKFTNFSLFQNINPKSSGDVLGSQFILLYGEITQTIKLDGISLKLSPASFLQVNECVQDKIYNFVLENIDKNAICVNGYSGAGFLTAMLAKKGQFIYGVEINKDASKNADNLIKGNQIDNVKNICGDFSQILPILIKKEIKNNNFNLIIDPPRKGIDINVIKTILKCKPLKIVYVSCNPATLSRDIQLLDKDYIVKIVQPFDMFPQTKHVENVAILTLK